MLLACPHCGYHLALILPTPTPSPGPSPRCPRCDGVVEPLSPRAGDGAADESVAGDSAIDPPASAEVGGANAAPGELSNAAEPNADAVDGPASDANASVAARNPRHRPDRTARAMPSFVRGSSALRPRRRSWPWYAAAVALAMVLALQLLLAQRHELATSTRWRPWVAALCDALPCDIPPWREPGAFTMLGRSVQPSRTLPDVLVVEASFRNDARWPQPWPTLLLTLSDVEGRDVGARAFAPSDYRPGRANAGDRLGPGQSATVHLQVREPASGVVAFTFDFQ